MEFKAISPQHNQDNAEVYLVHVPLKDSSNQPNSHSNSPLLYDQKPNVPEPRRDHSASKVHTQSRRTTCTPSWQWLWELASLVVAFGCTSLTIAILSYMNDKPLSHWKLSIAPNSLVAVFSTLAKSALLLPLAECIGQLKWHYYERQHPLHGIEDFDRASRGPWGATIFILKLWRSAPFAAFGALVIVLMLAFEPLTQQVIAFSTRTVPVPDNGEFTLGTHNWTHSITDPPGGSRNSVFYPLQMGVIDVAARVSEHKYLSPADNAYCPSSECHYDDFTALSACATCESEVLRTEDLVCSGTYTDSTIGNGSSTTLRNYQEYIKVLKSLSSDLNKWPDHVIINMTCTFESKSSKNGSGRRYPAYPIRWKLNYNVSSIDIRPLTQFFYAPKTQPSQAFATTCTYAPRDDNEHLAGIGHWKAPYGPPVVDSFTCFNSTLERGIYDGLLNVDVIAGTMSHCAIDYCAQTYAGNTYKNGTYTSVNITSTPLTVTSAHNQTWEGIPAEIYTLHADGVDEPFYISAFDALYTRDYVYSTSTGFRSWEPYLEDFLARTNGSYNLLFDGMAELLSGVIQRKGTIKVTGSTFRAEVWVTVRWQWLVLPIFAVLATMVFTVGTVVASRRREYVFKGSAMTGLVLVNGGQEVGKGKVGSLELLSGRGRDRVRLVKEDGMLRLKMD